jgi:hypothetical protein
MKKLVAFVATLAVLAGLIVLAIATNQRRRPVHRALASPPGRTVAAVDTAQARSGGGHVPPWKATQENTPDPGPHHTPAWRVAPPAPDPSSAIPLPVHPPIR